MKIRIKLMRLFGSGDVGLSLNRIKWLFLFLLIYLMMDQTYQAQPVF